MKTDCISTATTQPIFKEVSSLSQPLIKRVENSSSQSTLSTQNPRLLATSSFSDLIQSIFDKILNFFASCLNFFSKPENTPAPSTPQQGGAHVPVQTQPASAPVNLPRANGPGNILAFYQGSQVNIDGVTLPQMLGWNNDRLETIHNYIQWMFPTNEPSASNSTAPVLDQATIDAFRGNAYLKLQLFNAFMRILSFYGLRVTSTTPLQIGRADNFDVRAAVWLVPDGHNFKRITRILRSLDLLGLPNYNRAFYAILIDIANNSNGVVPSETRVFWNRAVSLS